MTTKADLEQRIIDLEKQLEKQLAESDARQRAAEDEARGLRARATEAERLFAEAQTTISTLEAARPKHVVTAPREGAIEGLGRGLDLHVVMIALETTYGFSAPRELTTCKGSVKEVQGAARQRLTTEIHNRGKLMLRVARRERDAELELERKRAATEAATKAPAKAAPTKAGEAKPSGAEKAKK